MKEKYSRKEINEILLSKSLNEFYFATIENRTRMLTDEEYEKIMQNKITSPNVDEMLNSIKKDEKLKDFYQEISKTLLSLARVRYVAILTLIDDEVYDIGGNEFLDLKSKKIIHYDNFTNYYNELNSRVVIFTPQDEKQLKENTALMDVDDLSILQAYENKHVHQEESDDLTNQFLEQVKGRTYTYKK